MANIENISIGGSTQAIGGDEFDGQWVEDVLTLSSSFTLSPGATKTFSLSSYLPDDGYDYEVIFESTAQTSSTSGDYAEVRACSGTGTSGFMSRLARIRTRTANAQIGTVTFITPILNSDKNITIETYSGSVGTATLGLYARRYRRIGLNGTHSDYISNINVNGTQYDINGNFLNGEWNPANSQLFSSTLAQNAGSTIDLSSYLPNDGYKYEVMFSVTAVTGTTSGNSVAPRLGISTGTGNPVICRHFTRTASNMRCAGNVLVAVVNRSVQVYNSGNATSGTITVTARGYRRIGTND